jgi:hypothetical protein
LFAGLAGSTSGPQHKLLKPVVVEKDAEKLIERARSSLTCFSHKFHDIFVIQEFLGSLF